MMLGVLQSNRENVVKVVRRFREALGEIENALDEKNEAQLQTLLIKAESRYNELMTH
jgi:prephenate dehydrogenase